MELYYIIAVTDSDRGEAMNALFRETGLPMILSAPGRGTAKNEHLAVYGLDETPKTVTTSVASAQEAAQLVKAVDGDQLFSGALALAHLHQHVGASGDDLGLGMLQPQADGVLDAFGLVER